MGWLAAGHADFSFEVKRSLFASDGCVLLVDASQGPQAQTYAHLQKALDRGLPIVAALNKAGPCCYFSPNLLFWIPNIFNNPILSLFPWGLLAYECECASGRPGGVATATCRAKGDSGGPRGGSVGSSDRDIRKDRAGCVGLGSRVVLASIQWKCQGLCGFRASYLGCCVLCMVHRDR